MNVLPEWRISTWGKPAIFTDDAAYAVWLCDVMNLINGSGWTVERSREYVDRTYSLKGIEA